MADEQNRKKERNIHYEAGLPILSPLPEDKDAEESKHRKAERDYQDRQTSLQVGILRTQIALVLFGVVGAGVSIWQARTAQQATDTSDRSLLFAQKSERDAMRISERAAQQAADTLSLTRQLTEGTNEAICYLRAFPDDTKSIVHLTFFNSGKATAKSFSSFVKFSIHLLPDNREIGAPQSINFSQNEIAGHLLDNTYIPTGHGEIDQDVTVPMLNLHRSKIEHFQEAFMIEADMTYDNGFGTTKTFSFCQELVRGRNGPGSTEIYSDSLVECSRLSAFLQHTRELENEQKQHQTQQQ